VVHAVARLLPRFRLLNACFTDGGIVVYQPVHIGLASDVGRDDAVMVPVVRDADRKPLVEIARETAGLFERLGAHALRPGDLADATFTLADQRALGIDLFVPILNDRQSAVLGICPIRQRVVPRGGQMAIAPVANLVVAFDHRVLNATTAARFLSELRDAIEIFTGEAACGS
jgi:pyruvate dehydrogenase E2 component (dihydrolipoamide acetyltransferase)